MQACQIRQASPNQERSSFYYSDHFELFDQVISSAFWTFHFDYQKVHFALIDSGGKLYIELYLYVIPSEAL